LEREYGGAASSDLMNSSSSAWVTWLTQNTISCDHDRGELSSGPIEESDAVGKLANKAQCAIGDRIRHARVGDGLRQYQIAERAGFSRCAVTAWELGQGISREKLVLFAQIVGVSAEWLITGERALETRRVRAAEFDPDQLEMLMAAAFELLGKPQGQAQELSKAILKAAERPQAGDRENPDRDLMRRLVQFLIRMYAP
jgi:transcriptional regulator with XRE-family HTH domain